MDLASERDVLIGERLVETDEDEPKPVTGVRISQRVHSAAPREAVATEVERGPSNSAERKRVVKMASDDVPDLTLNPSPLDGWLRSAPAPTIGAALGFQYLASVMALQIQHPDLAHQPLSSDQVGLEGVLRACETLLRKNGLYRSRR